MVIPQTGAPAPISSTLCHRHWVKYPIPRAEIRGNEIMNREPSKAGRPLTPEHFSSFLKEIQPHMSREPQQAAGSGHLHCSRTSRPRPRPGWTGPEAPGLVEGVPGPARPPGAVPAEAPHGSTRAPESRQRERALPWQRRPSGRARGGAAASAASPGAAAGAGVG